MRKRRLVVLGGLIVCLVAVIVCLLVFLNNHQGEDSGPDATRNEVTSRPWRDVSIDENEVISLVNQKRAEAGVAPVARNDLLDKSAATKCQDMVDRNYYDHVTPDGKHSWDFVLEVGYNYLYEGENLQQISYATVTTKSIVDGWFNSPGHRENMLNSVYTDTGFAFCVDTSYDRAFAVQHFASPR